jgi:hypothetical protein
MSKQHKTAGVSYETLTVDGKTYKLRPLKVGVYGEMESYVLSLRADPLRAAGEAVAKLPAQYHAAIWEAAMKVVMAHRVVTNEEMAAFERSLKGIAWMLWKCLEQDQPEIGTPEKAFEIVMAAGAERAEEIQRKLHVASGQADLGKSSGQAEATTTAPDPAGQ